MKIKKKFKILFLLIIILTIGIIVINNNKKTTEVTSEVDKLMNQYGISSDLYSKTLEYVLLNNIYNEKYLNEYKDIEYNDNNNFETIVTTFLPKGYKGTEINYIFKLSDKNIEKLKELNYIDISKYYNISNFNVDNIDRYNKYYELNNNLDIKTIVTYVNINLDLDYYTNTLEVSNPNEILVLVNKYNYLPSGYEPSDIVYLDGAYGNQVPVREVIKEAFLNLQKDAKNNGINLMPTTAYRSESFQKTLYNNYVAKDGIKAADTYSARPSYSEHETGLAIDLRNNDLGSNIRLTDDNYKWLEENSYKYGFIIRFPKDKEAITGYQFENWHIRYVGIDNATIIHDNNLTLEEYIDLYITEY